MYNQRKISKMQCVKLRSVMGSYLNIHLNLFPIYVLLLLLTLSHGRPSAKVRETRDEVAKSHRQQFRDKWYQSHNLYPSSSVNSVSNEYNSNSVVYDSNNPAKNTQVSSVVNNQNFETLVETLPRLPKATSSHADAISQYITKVVDNDETEKESASSKVSESAKPTMNPNVALGNPTTDLVESGEQLESYQGTPDLSNTRLTTIKHGYGEEQMNTFDQDIMSDQGAPYMGNVEQFPAMEDEQTVDIVLEGDGRNNDLLGSQQLITFRQNILRSLGHTETTFQVNTAPTNVTLDYNDDGSLAKYNITKKEYLQAYAEYMTNVKNRKLANRGLIGVKDRRKKAVSISKTYHDNGTDLFSIGTKVLKLFRFDIHYGPTMEGADVRIRRVVLSVPAACQITGHLQNNTDLPDLQELSNLTMSGNENEHGGEDEQVSEFDLTQNVTAWTVRSRTSSPFIVLAICSRDTVPDKLESDASYNHHPSHHGSSLKVVTKEFMKPSYEAKMKRRARRAAPTEPSTLRGFTHKRDNGRGRECANTRHGKTCCRRSLKIKFEDLGISDVILEPKEFDAHVCEGRCNARRVAYASTHAMFQHILHQTKGKKFAPRPCCVPTALTELDVLHLDQSGNRNGGPKLIVTILKDAVVKECGCS